VRKGNSLLSGVAWLMREVGQGESTRPAEYN